MPAAQGESASSAATQASLRCSQEAMSAYMVSAMVAAIPLSA